MLVTEGDENLLFLRDQVTYSHQISDMADENQRSWKNESTDSAPDTTSTEQSDKNIKRCRYSRKGKEKVSLKDRQCIQKKVERKSWPELVITKVRGAKSYTKRLHVVQTSCAWRSDSTITFKSFTNCLCFIYYKKFSRRQNHRKFSFPLSWRFNAPY